MWDVDFQTAVAQAEFEEREVKAAYHRLGLPAARDGDEPARSRSRPPGRSCCPSCVALVAHPDDERYAALVGTEVLHAAVRRRGSRSSRHPLADPDKGSGIAMICTFGDTADVIWWRELDLPLRSLVQRDGRMQHDVPDWLAAAAGAGAWTQLAGATVAQARRRIVELLESAGRPGRRAPPDHPPGEVLREGRASAGDRHQPAVVHPQRRPRRRRCSERAAGPRPRAALAPGLHAGAATSTGSKG